MIAEPLTRELQNQSALPTTTQSIGLTLTFNHNNGSHLMSWSSESVSVTQDIANFTLTLVTQNAPAGAVATFTGAINWLDSQKASISQPSNITSVNGGGTASLTFTDNNPGGDVTWGFSVGVSFQGTALTSPDPTIVNKDV